MRRCDGSKPSRPTRTGCATLTRRGDVVIASAGGDYGKPRPAVVVQTYALPREHASVIICQITSMLVEPSLLRLTIDPGPSNGLSVRSQVMVDKPITVRRTKITRIVGRLDEAEIANLNRTLLFVLGLAD